ncbi:MAG: LLM class flavin-dependent oxidoreductase, partial [Alphaproteobacteria bacterium]
MTAFDVFTTCPQSKDHPPGDYLARVADVARWSEAAGARGILVYADNGLVDPWLIAQKVVDATTALSPLVAVQPIYMHPYAAAKMAATITALSGRRVFLNMIAGGFRNDLDALCDETPHDERYARLTEYTRIVADLMAASATGKALTFEGRYYRVRNLRMAVRVPEDLQPGIFVSGSSEAGRDAAAALGAVAVEYPGPPETMAPAVGGGNALRGFRVGIVARPERDEAWAVAEARFPPDRRGQMAHGLAMKTSDSAWHRQLSEQAVAVEAEERLSGER